MKTSQQRRLFSAMVLFFGILLVLSADTSVAMTRQLTNNNFLDLYPDINDLGQVVWSGTDGTYDGLDVFFWNGNATEQLSDNDLFDGGAKLNDLGQVTWYARDHLLIWSFIWDGTVLREFPGVLSTPFNNIANGHGRNLTTTLLTWEVTIKYFFMTVQQRSS